MSWWSGNTDTHSSSIHPVTFTPQAQSQPFSELTREDLEWTFAQGFATETRTFYISSKDGLFAFVQVIHNSLNGWKNTIQLTCRIYDPNTKDDNGKPFSFWRSFNLSSFETDKDDKASVSSNDGKLAFKLNELGDAFEISCSADPKNRLVIPQLIISRVGQGWKCSPDAKTHFGNSKSDGYVLHKFWPKCNVKGTFIANDRIIDIEGSGLLVHAIQGLRPNLIANAWNFANFQSIEQNTSLALMEFTTQPNYGSKVISVGSITIDGELIAVTIENSANHIKTSKDPETQYDAPSEIEYTWRGKTLDGKNPVEARIVVKDLGITNRHEGGLIEKVDVLGEIPGFLKKFLNVVANTKPYIYQWWNQASVEIIIAGKTHTISGHLLSEATFISP